MRATSMGACLWHSGKQVVSDRLTQIRFDDAYAIVESSQHREEGGRTGFDQLVLV
jgi:hypothetical protein